MEKSDSKSSGRIKRVSRTKRFWKPANLVKIFVFLSIAFICGVFFFIRSRNFLDWAEGRLELELQNQITDGYTAEVGKIEGNILGSITIENIAIAEKDAQNPPIISTGKVTLIYNLFGLLTRTFEVKQLKVVRPEIHVVRESDGSFNLEDIFKTRKTQGPAETEDSSQFDFAAEYIRFGNGTITYIDAEQDLRIGIQGISIAVNGRLNTWDHKGVLNIRSGGVRFNGTEMEIDDFNANFVILANGSRLDNLQLTFGNSELRVKGGFTHEAHVTDWDGILDLELDLADVDQFFNETHQLEGVLAAKIEAEGTDSDLDVKMLSVDMPTFSVANAESNRKIRLADLEVKADFKHSPTPTFTLQTFSTKIADGSLVGEGIISLENAPEVNLLTQLRQLPQHPFTYTGEWRATEIQLIPFLSMFVQLPDNLSDSVGSLSGTAKFSGNSMDISNLNLDSEMTLIGSTLDEVVLEDSMLNCTVASGELNANGNLDETVIEINAPFPLQQQDAIDIQASNIIFGKLTKIVNTANFGGTGTSSAQLSSDGTLSGYLEVQNSTFNDIPIGVLTGNFRYRDGQVFIENGLLTKNTKNDDVTPYQSRAMIKGTVDINKDEFPSAFSIVADTVYVQHYPRLLMGAEYPVDAAIRGELKLDGTLINLDGRANFSVSEGVAWGIHLDPLMLPLEIEDYNLSVSNFKITTREQQLTLNTTVASNGDFNFLLESDAPVSFQEIAKAANISDLPFAGEFDVRVVGTLKRPESADFRVELDFSDITFLHGSRGTKHLIGDAYLLGKLVAGDKTIGKSDIFDFQGQGLGGSSRIRGVVSMAVDNPYRFVVESAGIRVDPFLSILHPMLESVTGNADGRVSINGTIADLAPAPTSTQSPKKKIYPYDVDIHIDTSRLRYGNSTERGVPFTNSEPIRLHLGDDRWTIDNLSLRTFEDVSPFVNFTGIFDAKTEAMNLRVGSNGFELAPFGPALGLSDDVLPIGAAYYTMQITGTPASPVLAVEWTVPTLTLKTEIGDFYISDSGGTIAYQDEVLRLEDCAFKLFGNDVNVAGYVDVQPEDVNNSELHLRVDTIALDLATLPMEVIEQFGSENEITGVLEVSVEIGDTFAEPHALLYAETSVERPIRLSPYVPSIKLDRLRVDIDFDAESVHIHTIEANGEMGTGSYLAKGDAMFSRNDMDPMRFAIDVSASQVEIGNYGIASGHVEVSGTGLAPHQITVNGEISELTLDGYDLHLVNTAPLQFRSDAKGLAGHIPLELTSSAITALINVNTVGTLDAPDITVAWDGTFNQKEWVGNIQYSDQQITLAGITLKDGTDTLTLSGVIPFNLAFTGINVSEGHLKEPIDVHLRGRELPINFFPGVDTFFSETDGTVDIDLSIQGTSLAPYMMGHVSLEALQLDLKNFHEPIQNMKVQLSASKDIVDIRDFQFDIGSGYCTLREGQLALNGLLPKELRLASMRFERFPLGSTVQQMVPPEVMEEVEGHLTTRLEELTVPLDSFFVSAGAIPLPQIREVPSLVNLLDVSSGSLSIDSVRLAFKALDRSYDFQDPSPVPIVLSNGTVTLGKMFSLENQETFPVTQTFSDEDRKPEGIEGNKHTFSARTTFSLDAGSSLKTNGEFDAALRIAHFDVSTLTDAWPLSYRVRGALSGSLQLSGTSENPKITIRRHTSDPAELYLHDVPIDLRWRIRYQYGKWEISKKRYVEVTYGENLLTFSWMMPYKLELIPFLQRLQESPELVWQEFKQTPMEGILDIKLDDLEMLPLVVTGLGSASGAGKIYVELTGTIEAPQAIGSVSFNDVGLEFPEAGIYVNETVGEIRLSEKGANITRFDGTLNDGAFSIRGNITAPQDRRIWQTPPTLDLSTTITEVIFEQSEAYQAELNSADLRLHGELLRPYLTGNLNINGGYYQQNWEIVRDWLTGVSIKEADIVLDYPILRDLQLNVDIDIPSDFRVLSSITGPTDIEIACLGKLVGPINQPVFSGDVSVRSGKIGLITQPFEFIEGSTISNRDNFNFNPDLNIYLRTPERIRGVLPRDESIVDIQVHAAITGTLNNPNFTLSAPTATTAEVLTHEDIIAFLLRNTAISRTFGGFTFSIQRPFEDDTRYYGEYPLGENMSIKVETNDQGEHGVDFELKGRF